MSVNLGGGEHGVAEEFLYVAEVGAAVEQVCGEAVSEHVGTDGSVEPELFGVFGYDSMDIPDLKRQAVEAQEDLVFGQSLVEGDSDGEIFS